MDLHGKIPEGHAVALEELFLSEAFVVGCVAYPKTGTLAIRYCAASGQTLGQARKAVLAKLAGLSKGQVAKWQPEDSQVLTPRPRHLFASLASMTLWHC